MDNLKLAELLFPDVEITPQQYLTEIYPKRELKEGAIVSRFAPSPTGFIHIGNLFTSMIGERAAHLSGGVAFLRIEDTDKKREKEDGVTTIVKGLKGFGISFDEGALDPENEIGDYGPYTQSKRVPIYHSFARSLVEKGLAYPCFCTEEEIAALREQQEKQNVLPGYYGQYAACRNLTFEQIAQNLEQGKPWVLRLRSPGVPGNRFKFRDVLRGDMELEENIHDIVLLKRDGVPTYHFAHVVDDTLMGTTHVIRGEEWISSVPVHMQLFKVLELKPMKFVHVSPIMKNDGGSKRKLSKRKDPEAAVSWFLEKGYPRDAVMEYLLTIANSNFEDWRRANKQAPWQQFPFSFKKMSQSGALFDVQKLNSVSSNLISRMSAEQVYELACAWAEQYDEELYAMLTADADFSKAVFAVDRGGNNPRKDIAKWDEVKDYVSYFFTAPDVVSERPEILKEYLEHMDLSQDKTAWFETIRSICPALGYCPDVKAYKAEPEKYKGHVGDVSEAIRVAVTGRRNTPDLHAIMTLLGEDECRRRIEKAIG